MDLCDKEGIVDRFPEWLKLMCNEFAMDACPALLFPVQLKRIFVCKLDLSRHLLFTRLHTLRRVSVHCSFESGPMEDFQFAEIAMKRGPPFRDSLDH